MQEPAVSRWGGLSVDSSSPVSVVESAILEVGNDSRAAQVENPAAVLHQMLLVTSNNKYISG